MKYFITFLPVSLSCRRTHFSCVHTSFEFQRNTHTQTHLPCQISRWCTTPRAPHRNETKRRRTHCFSDKKNIHHASEWCSRVAGFSDRNDLASFYWHSRRKHVFQLEDSKLQLEEWKLYVATFFNLSSPSWWWGLK